MSPHELRGESVASDTARAMADVARSLACASATAAAEDVARSLGVCCDVLDRSIWPEVAWRFSGLTADGCPLEFTISSVDNSLRSTVDVAPPEMANHHRIAAACELATRLGYQPLDAASAERWTLMQQGHHLSWGARLGVRESAHSGTAKVYLEVPLDAQPSIRSGTALPLGDSVVVMVGIDPERGLTEYYVRQKELSPAQLTLLLRTLVSDEERRTMIAGIEQVCGMPLVAALRWVCFGYSLAVDPRRGSSPTVTLFARSRAIGGAALARARVLRCASPPVRQGSLYCRLIAGVPDGQLPDHGVVAAGVRAGVPEMRIGLSGVALSRLLRESRSDLDGCF